MNFGSAQPSARRIAPKYHRYKEPRGKESSIILHLVPILPGLRRGRHRSSVAGQRSQDETELFRFDFIARLHLPEEKKVVTINENYSNGRTTFYGLRQ